MDTQPHSTLKTEGCAQVSAHYVLGFGFLPGQTFKVIVLEMQSGVCMCVCIFIDVCRCTYMCAHICGEARGHQLRFLIFFGFFCFCFCFFKTGSLVHLEFVN